ncbi:unnamed protein product [Sphagnum compactum]
MKSEYGSLLPPLPSCRSNHRHRLLSSGSYIAEEAENGEMVEDSALDISHIEVAADYEGQSPDSMVVVDEANATFSSLGNISMMHSPEDEEEHGQEGTGNTAYLQSLLFSTEKKELRVNKRKLAHEDEEEAMTGSRLVSDVSMSQVGESAVSRKKVFSASQQDISGVYASRSNDETRLLSPEDQFGLNASSFVSGKRQRLNNGDHVSFEESSMMMASPMEQVEHSNEY